jgi:hypothetical protein
MNYTLHNLTYCHLFSITIAWHLSRDSLIFFRYIALGRTYRKHPFPSLFQKYLNCCLLVAAGTRIPRRCLIWTSTLTSPFRLSGVMPQYPVSRTRLEPVICRIWRTATRYTPMIDQTTEICFIISKKEKFDERVQARSFATNQTLDTDEPESLYTERLCPYNRVHCWSLNHFRATRTNSCVSVLRDADFFPG